MATRIKIPTGVVRKRPHQARARATRDAILDAAAHILGERGWRGLTTNVVADVARVSIGSLYQSYPNKLALIEDVRRRHFEEVLTVLRAATDEDRSRPDRLAALVDGMIAVHSRYPTAHRVLLEEAPRGEDAKSGHDWFETECHKLYEAIFRANYRRTVSAKVGGQVLASALAGAVHHAAARGQLTSPVMRAELLRLASLYL